MKKPRKSFSERFAQKVTNFTGSNTAFSLSCLLIVLWLITGPVFNYSDTWQLVINTGTTIITFLMVFLIQRAQNKESMAVQLKLNELIAAVEGASNRLIDAEDFTEKDLEILHKHFKRLAEMTKKTKDVLSSHSIEEAEKRHNLKFSSKISKEHGKLRKDIGKAAEKA
jgi:low affinity Fe/Cu permease